MRAYFYVWVLLGILYHPYPTASVAVPTRVPNRAKFTRTQLPGKIADTQAEIARDVFTHANELASIKARLNKLEAAIRNDDDDEQEVEELNPPTNAPTIAPSAPSLPPTPNARLQRKILQFKEATWKREFNAQVLVRGTCVNELMSFKCLGQSPAPCEP